MKKSNALALIPIGVFIVFYLSLGVIFEYVMKMPMGFYNVPVVVAFLIALFVAIIQTRGETLEKKFAQQRDWEERSYRTLLVQAWNQTGC